MPTRIQNLVSTRASVVRQGAGCALALALLGWMAPVVRAAEAAAPIRVLLITGGCCHDYANQKEILKKGLEERANIVVDQVHTPTAPLTLPCRRWETPIMPKVTIWSFTTNAPRTSRIRLLSKACSSRTWTVFLG